MMNVLTILKADTVILVWLLMPNVSERFHAGDLISAGSKGRMTQVRTDITDITV